LTYLAQNLQSVLAASANTDFLVLLVELVDFGCLQVVAELLESLFLLKVTFFELKLVGRRHCEISQAMVLERGKDQVRLLSLHREIFALQNGVEYVIFGRMHLDALLPCPFGDLQVPPPRERRVVVVVIERVDGLTLVDALQDIEGAALHKVEPSPMGLDLLA
jgi:hypothetical protein